MKITANPTPTHNPWGEAYWASGLRENLTSRSYGEGLETGRALTQVPRQSFTRQRTHSWLSRFRRLTIGYERRNEIHLAFLHLGCALIGWNFMVNTFC